MLLDSIHKINDLRGLGIDQLKILSDELRSYIIDVVSKNGGHLASSLGTVELTIALHYVFNTPYDRIIWDVGHQSYAHKILTGRKSEFATLRKFNGLSGFPKVSESKFDTYNTGHSSTSLSLALGDAVGRDLKREKYKVIAVIGDGSMTGGMAFEALNQIGHLKKDLIIILNDNEHSISKNVGALSEYFMRLITGSLYNRLRKRSYDIIRRMPRYGARLYDFIYTKEARLKGMFIPGSLFEEMGIRYFGPVDGHNLGLMIDMLNRIKNINNGPKIIHVLTKKGKGYEPAEKNPDFFHGVGPFDKTTGAVAKSSGLSYSEIAGKTLSELNRHDKKIVAITAAMKLGTGLYEFEKHAPNRFFDVGIAEQHAVTFASALAAKGFKPFVSVYSTFLQRAVDQLIHDVAIMNLPVKILVDRAGIVGEDGETHHGLFDIGFIKNIPNFMLLAPSNGQELRDMIYFAAEYNDGPIAIRYPRGREITRKIAFREHNSFVPGKISRLSKGKDITLLAIGEMVAAANEVKKALEKDGIGASVVKINSIKPLDVAGIESVIRETGRFITLENGYSIGGAGEYILSHIAGDLRSGLLFCGGFPDRFIPHGKNSELFQSCGLTPQALADTLKTALKVKSINEKRHSVRRISG